MKTKRAMKEYECYQCKAVVPKGTQYARRSFRMGEQGMASYDGTVREWEPYRVTMPICEGCAGEPANA